MVPRTLTVATGTEPSGIGRTLALLGILVVCCATRIFALNPTSRISQYGHTAWRLQDGYFGGIPAAIAQTTDGYIWVGTDAGLFKFDGVRFIRWSAQSGEQLPPSRIASLLGARDGSLWIGTDDGLAHLMNNRLTLYKKTQRWLVMSLIEDREGKIWFTDARSEDKTHPLCQVVNLNVRCYGSEEGVDADGGGPLAADNLDNLWIGGETTLVRWRPGASQVYRPQSLRSNQGNAGVTGLAAMTDGSLWVGIALPGRGGGLQHMVDGTLERFRVPKLNGETLLVQTLYRDRQSSLWVGTSQGLFRIRGADVDRYGSAEGLSADYVYGIFEDREGNLWVATAQGIDMFRDLPVRSVSKHEGLNEDAVESVAASRDGSVWIGTSRLQVLESGGVSLVSGKELPGNQVTSLFVDHTGRLWAGMNNKLFVNERGGFRQITKEDGGALGMVMGITEDSEQTIWVESRGPPATLLRIQDLKVRQELPAPETPSARRIVADPQRGIWLGLVTGDLARFRDGKIQTFTFGNHANTHVLAITAASDGSILGGTAFGVVGWKNGRTQTLTTKNGLPCNTITALISDNAGNLWLYAQCGLIEISNDQMQLWWEHPGSKLNVRVFDTFDGVQSGLGHFNTSAKTPDGRLWFANGSVVQTIDPANISENTLPPPVHISGLIADRKAYALEWGVRLPPRTGDLEIDYTALSFGVPQKVLFRYKLEGRDTEWVEAATRRQAFYNDLPPRHYRFRVIACNNDGVWNETGAFLDFSIAPAYYQTNWFRALCLAVFLGILWALHQFRIWRLRQSEIRLRKVIATIPTFAWTASPDGSVDFLNRHYENYTGVPVEKAVGSCWTAVVHPEDLQRYLEKFRSSMATGEPFEIESRFRRADGQYRWFLTRAVALRDSRGKIVKWYGTSIEIEDRKRAEQLQADLAHVSRVNTMSELTASLAHEVKQPIGAAVTNAESCLRLLNRNEPDLPDAREAALEMTKDARRAADIIDRVRLLYQKGQSQLEPVDVNEVIAEMLIMLRNQASRHSVTMSADLVGGLTRVMADRVQLQQVFMNLMLNGIDAMKGNGGELSIKSQLSKDGELLISVTDTGVGLPVERADEIFNAFFTTKPDGTGLGLAISRSILESHGGRVWAIANSGQGTTFYFTLPIRTSVSA